MTGKRKTCGNAAADQTVCLKWYTIPPFLKVKAVSPYGKEYGEKPRTDCTLKNLHILARSGMEYKKEQGRIRVRITADDYYKLYVNGRYVGQGPAPAYPEDYFYNELDLTPFLREGDNVLAVHLYYQGLLNRVWNSGDGRFGVAAQIVNENGTTKDCVWKYQISRAYSGETTGYDTQFLEDFDSRFWNENWSSPDFDDISWDEMVPVPNPDYRLSLQPVRMLDVSVRKPAAVRKDAAGWFIDMGEEITGALRICARAKEGKKILILCGEECREDGSVRWEMRCNVTYRETWTLTSGENVLEPYDYKGFRYARLVPEEDVSIQWVEAVVRHYPMGEECSLRCSDSDLEQIFQICRNAVKYGTQEGYLDCPTREKGQYLGDALVTALSQVWLTGTVEMLRKCIRQFAVTDKICPGLMAVAPGSVMQEIADYSLLWPWLLLTDYRFTGDRDFLGKYYSTAKGILDYFGRYQRGDGLLVQVDEKWNLVDWPENLRDGYDMDLDRPLTSPVCHNVINALYIGATQALTITEELLGLPPSLDPEKLKASYVKTFYDPGRKCFRDSEKSTHTALHSNIYALYFGLCPEESTDAIADFLIRKGMCCGVFTAFFYLKALARAGRYDALYQVLENKSERGWINMIREGATTCFESWGKEMKWNTSLCHPWASAPIPVIIEDIGGFRPVPEKEGGYVFSPHIPEQIIDFRLRFRFRGEEYEIRKKGKEVELFSYTCQEERT